MIIHLASTLIIREVGEGHKWHCDASGLCTDRLYYLMHDTMTWGWTDPVIDRPTEDR